MNFFTKGSDSEVIENSENYSSVDFWKGVILEEPLNTYDTACLISNNLILQYSNSYRNTQQLEISLTSELDKILRILQSNSFDRDIINNLINECRHLNNTIDSQSIQTDTISFLNEITSISKFELCNEYFSTCYADKDRNKLFDHCNNYLKAIRKKKQIFADFIERFFNICKEKKLTNLDSFEDWKNTTIIEYYSKVQDRFESQLNNFRNELFKYYTNSLKELEVEKINIPSKSLFHCIYKEFQFWWIKYNKNGKTTHAYLINNEKSVDSFLIDNGIDIDNFIIKNVTNGKKKDKIISEDKVIKGCRENTAMIVSNRTDSNGCVESITKTAYNGNDVEKYAGTTTKFVSTGKDNCLTKTITNRENKGKLVEK